MTPQKQGIHNLVTANSTPEKNEVDDFTQILDPLDRRVLKSQPLTLEIRRSSDAARGVTPSQASLMPKRIMSAKKKSSEKKAVAVKRVPKDRSALIGVKRTRKSRDQICELQKMYEDSKGKPTKAQLKALAEETGLKLQQVYKWYWDTEKKNDKLQKEIRETDPECESPMRLSRKILKT